MLKMKLPKWFKKKELTEEEKWLKQKLKKTPRKFRKKAIALWELARRDLVLKVGDEEDQKERLKEAETWYNGQVV